MSFGVPTRIILNYENEAMEEIINYCNGIRGFGKWHVYNISV